MNRDNTSPDVGKMVLGFGLAILLAALAPVLMLTEIMSLMMLIMLPSIGIVFLYRWTGRAPAILCGMLQLLFSAMYLGGTFMWMAFCAAILPAVVIVKNENKPFFMQMQHAIVAFGLGIVAAVVILYLNYGGNMIERALIRMPEVMRTLPAEALSTPMANLGAVLGRELDVESFYTVFDQMIQNLIPYYQIELPGLIFGGALISAVICVGLNSGMRFKRGQAVEGSCIPLRDWALPASTTGGLVLILVVSYLMLELGMKNGEAVFIAVDVIAMTAFCIQAMASIARRMYATKRSAGIQKFILVLVGVACLTGGLDIVGLYGLCSASFGTKGAFRQRLEKKNKQSDDET